MSSKPAYDPMNPITKLGAPASQFNEAFTNHMRAAMATSFHKYGHMREAASHGVDLVASLEQRLALYKETGNSEHLVDVANFAMIEFTAPSQTDPAPHFRPTDSDESPGIAVKPKINIVGNKVQQRNHHGKHEEL